MELGDWFVEVSAGRRSGYNELRWEARLACINWSGRTDRLLETAYTLDELKEKLRKRATDITNAIEAACNGLPKEWPDSNAYYEARIFEASEPKEAG